MNKFRVYCPKNRKGLFMPLNNSLECLHTAFNTEKLFATIELLPTWVKKYVLLRLQSEIKKDATSENNSRYKKNLYLYTPKLTVSGDIVLKKLVYNRAFVQESHPLTTKHIQLLMSISTNSCIIEACNDMHWSISCYCKHLNECIQTDYVEAIIDPYIDSLILYIINEIRLGEFFLRVQRISLNEVMEALNEQKTLKEAGQKVKIGELLVKKGYITKEERNLIIKIKEDSELHLSFMEQITLLHKHINELKAAIELICKENNDLNQGLKLLEKETKEQENRINQLSKEKELSQMTFKTSMASLRKEIAAKSKVISKQKEEVEELKSLIKARKGGFLDLFSAKAIKSRA